METAVLINNGVKKDDLKGVRSGFIKNTLLWSELSYLDSDNHVKYRVNMY